MQWKQVRILLILAVIFTALWYVYPSFRTSDYWLLSPVQSSLSADEITRIDEDLLLDNESKARLKQLNLTKPDWEALQDQSIRLGLDLQGGVHVVLEVDKSNLPEDEAVDVVERAMQVISNRVNEFGVAEPIIQKSGDNRIIVELPGLKDINRAMALINQTAQLEFKLLRDESELRTAIERIDALLAAQITDTTQTDTSASPFGSSVAEQNPFLSLIDVSGSEIIVPASNVTRVDEILARPDVQNFIPNGGEIRGGNIRESASGQRIRSYYYMNVIPEMTGATLADAYPQTGSGTDIGSMGVASIGFTTTDDGARTFARVTGNNIGRRMAIILDGRVFSAPNIQGRIPNGRGEITGMNSLEEAKDLSIVLRAGALPAPMVIQYKQVVGPSLGADAISSGKWASIMGLIAVFIFMAFYYRTSGLIANFALVLNLLFLLAVMAAFNATLTLPGIAGIILTMGMSIDANILIFERIKEELRAGKKTIRQAVNSGYDNALRTIVDANITTLITAFALYEFGTGPIRGFAVTLGFGIMISMFTAIVVTRTLYDTLIERWHLEGVSIGKADPFGRYTFSFMKFGKTAFIITWSVILIGLITIGVRGGIKWGLDFQGGSLIEVHFDPLVEVQTIRNALGNVTIDGQILDLSQSEIKTFGEDNILVRVASSEFSEEQLGTAVKATLKAQFPESLKGDESNWRRQESSVSPKIGKELMVDAMKAVGASIIGIILYITFRFRQVNGFRFGVGAIVALVHDVLIVLAVFSIIGEELSMPVVAALLTVVGYSTNDTIVVFDRIRESLGRARKEGFSGVVDRSVNDCLNRTMMTSLTVLLVLGFLLAGSTSSNWGFSLALTFGVITGTYSSIFIASPIVVWWQNWVAKKREEIRRTKKSTRSRVAQAG
ncbi:MAG: protein translocase subunit SecD [Gemmatimonadota bacterium]|nr:protein translocase subunit SecD [Gemmatimonadota bacterium]